MLNSRFDLNYMQELKGKTLLFLGGAMLDRHALLAAKEMGIRTVVANFYPAERSPAKYDADVAVDINNTDTDAMLQLIRNEGVDGIFGGYTDSSLVNYRQLCSLAGFPCYGTKEQFENTINKTLFKSMIRKYGDFAVEEYRPEDITEASSVEYPLYVKPVDSSGSRGCSACSNYAEFCESVKYAKAYSATETVTVEKYYDFRKYGDVIVCYSIRNGKVTPAAVGDRTLNQFQKNASPLPVCLTYPSKYLDAFLQYAHPQIKRMLEEEGFKNGSLFLQGFTDGRQFRFFDMGYRQNGSQQFILTRYFNGNDTLEEAIRYALTGEVDEEAAERDDPRFKRFARDLVLYLRPGRVAKIEGIEEGLRLPGVLCYTPWLMEGQEVGVQGTLGQSLGRFFFVADSMDAIERRTDELLRMVKAFDDEGRSLLIDQIYF